MSAAAAGVTESLFGRYFLYLMKKLSFRQTYSKQSLKLPCCWRKRCRGGPAGLVEVNSRLWINLAAPVWVRHWF